MYTRSRGLVCLRTVKKNSMRGEKIDILAFSDFERKATLVFKRYTSLISYALEMQCS